MKNRRGFWHEEAREMKRSGSTLRQIASHFGVSKTHISSITYGVPAVRNTNDRRSTVEAIAGVQTHSLKGIMCRFDEDTFNRIDIIRKARGISFSKAVSDLVGIAIEEIEA